MLKIVFTGPESSGKTTLSKRIAHYYNVPYVEEQSRIFLEKRPAPQYSYDDLSEMARLQVQAETAAQEYSNKTNSFYICDTDILTFKIWSNEVFNKCENWITQHIENQIFMKGNVLYFLCSPEGIVWEYDPLRENPNDRDRLFYLYEKELNQYDFSYKILRGGIEGRFEKVKTEINMFL